MLIVGGRDAAGNLASAELFDSTSRSFSWVGAMETARSGHTASLLGDGRVLIAGGGSNTVEFFDAAEGTFAAWPRAMN